MAQYYTDFSEYTTGQHPAGWTQRRDEATSWSVEADAGATGGKVLRFPGKAANTQSILTWDAIDSDSGRADVEILIRFRYGGTSASLYAWARDASTSSAATGYRIGDSYTGTTIGIIGKYVSGSYTNIYTAGGGAINATNTWAYIRAQISGNSLRVRVWKAGDPEPDTWRGTGTDNSLSTGRVGIMIFNTAPVDIDWIGIGTGGDPAPDSPVDPGEVDIHAAAARHGHRAAAAGLAQQHGLSLAPARSAHRAGEPALAQAHVLAVMPARHGQRAAAASFTQAHVLALPGAAHGHRAGPAALSGTSELAIAPGRHAHGAATVTVTQAHALLVDAAGHVQRVGTVTVAQAHALAPDGVAHAHRSGPATLIAEGGMAVAAARHRQRAVVVDLRATHALALLPARHGQRAGRPAIAQGHALVVAEARHLQAVEPAALSGVHALVISPALHAQLAGAAELVDLVPLPVDARLLFRVRIADPVARVPAAPVIFPAR